MKLSVLLPTRNRLEYLRLAIASVLRQDCPEWEVVISDNDSRDDIAGYAASLGDERIVYHRTSRFVSVTENWNNALGYSSGDYVVMLGDDDALTQGYVTRMRELVDGFQQPELVFTSALLFTYPGVDPSCPQGFVEPNGYAEFFGDVRQPFLLARSSALAAVRRTMAFRLAFAFNMQFSLISRRLIDEMQPYGDFFQSPFPDYYATTASFLKARTVVADPRPEVIVGVTPKSYGFFHVNEREDEGRSFLDPEPEHGPTPPGTNINDGWLGAAEAIEANFGADYGIRVNRRRYRQLQALNVYGRRARGASTSDEIARLHDMLSPTERLLYGGASALARLTRLLPARARNAAARRALGQFPDWRPTRKIGRYRDILEVFDGESPTSGSSVSSRPGEPVI
jgi:glycosyltransferase involved in cell wall biosynthesis